MMRAAALAAVAAPSDTRCVLRRSSGLGGVFVALLAAEKDCDRDASALAARAVAELGKDQVVKASEKATTKKAPTAKRTPTRPRGKRRSCYTRSVPVPDARCLHKILRGSRCDWCSTNDERTALSAHRNTTHMDTYATRLHAANCQSMVSNSNRLTNGDALSDHPHGVRAGRGRSRPSALRARVDPWAEHPAGAHAAQ